MKHKKNKKNKKNKRKSHNSDVAGDGGGAGGNKKRTVSFQDDVDTSGVVAAAAAAREKSDADLRRSRNDNRDGDDHDDQDSGVVRRQKKPRLDRPNMDELDDVDDWKPEDDDENDGGEQLPSERESLQARRDRKLRREVGDADETEETNIDATTSLMAEAGQNDKDAVAVTGFHMDEERTDGSGFFDGDTYVFRREKGEEDAWLDSIDEKKDGGIAKPKAKKDEKEDDDGTPSMDNLTKEELYAKIVPLVSDSETVLQALVRYGNLIKRAKKGKGGPKKGSGGTGGGSGEGLAQSSLNELTEASNALLLQGDVDIYQRTREDILKLQPTEEEQQQQQPKPAVQWEYKGNQDGQVHGPYSNADMLSWTKAGYFIGAQAVQIRTVRKGEPKPKSTKDELLSDLMDDDDDDDDDDGNKNSAEEELVRGEWQSSNEVNFNAYS